jgi:hypothetical protein
MVPPDADAGQREHYRRLVEQALHQATEMAEQLAEGRRQKVEGRELPRKPPDACLLLTAF